MPVLFALLAGTIFGAGLTISDMVNPARVLNFFDIAGSWDPSLLFVMGGALATTALGYRLALARSSPLMDDAFHLPTTTKIDPPLVGGAALFGVGWGLTGFCPGPAVAALVSLEPSVYMFVAAMLVAMVGTKILRDWRPKNV